MRDSQNIMIASDTNINVSYLHCTSHMVNIIISITQSEYLHLKTVCDEYIST